MLDQVCTRTATEADREFLFTLFLELRGAELGWFDLSDPVERHLLFIQHQAQERSYRMNDVECIREVICLGARPVGTVVTAESTGEVRIVDLALAQGWQGQGIGSRVMEQLMRRASLAGKPLALPVRNTNPAVRLYKRLGFRITSRDELHCGMALEP
jgi:ribosomal protein S18 acetylase RimI-like enzyme